MCEYADPLGVGEYAGIKGKCGKANMPCNGSCGGLGNDAGLHSDAGAGSEAQACDPGLTCTDVGGGDKRCLADCTSDADCPLPNVMACDEGVCRLHAK